MIKIDYSKKNLIIGSILFSVSIELFTIICRYVYGGTGAEFAAKHDVPAWLRIHHFWWGLLLILISFFLRKYPKLKFWILAIGLGVFFSDWLHHLVYSPIVFGNLSWHWP
ncbi:hypothetical protein JXA32_04995 [Candidatus Sumerlaeota bacterium]|nr:hypothetical protein [Candidatus Sumerlaeota bacterium]